jgi:RNA polymerase sigma factor (sigma-70 family)
MKVTLPRFWYAAQSNRAEKTLKDCLKSLSLYCRAPDPAAKNATDLHEAMKQFTWWPDASLLKRIENSVLAIALTERKYPWRRIWKNFALVNRRKTKLGLLKHVNELVKRARERFTDANFSDLEALSWEGRKDENARNLLRDIGRIKENVGAAKTIDWAQYKGILTRFSDNGSVAGPSGSDIALWCYARVLELILDDRRWEKLRTESEALVFWLLEIDYPDVSERDGLEQFNQSASFMWVVEESRKIQQKRAATLAKFQQSGGVIKKTKEDIEDDRLMALVSRNKGDALAKLRQRHAGLVRATVREVLKGNSDVDDIVDRVFVKVWKAAPEYVPTGKFTAWLTTIAKHLAIDEWRRAIAEKERVELAHITATGSKGKRKTVAGATELQSIDCAHHSDDDDAPGGFEREDIEDYFSSYQ